MLALSAMADTSTYDRQEPFGFCTRSSRTDATSTYDITGGGCYQYPVTGVSDDRVVTLTSTGEDMRDDIIEAIKNYDVIIFNGSKGDFIVSSTIQLNSVSGKTLLGINKARLCTRWYITPEIIEALNQAGVPNMSTKGGTGGIMTNGNQVGEEAEFNTRQTIINMTGDNQEQYRRSGIFAFRGCQNLIIRNLMFLGPGSIDVGGHDLISFIGTKNCWVDHCDFIDGMDGNFDITQKSDFNTISWCTFSYTERSYMHQNTNLIGFSDREMPGFLNTTYAFNQWGANCRARMPMGRVGKVHMLNNYYTAVNAVNCINPRKNSEFLIEGNYFETGVTNIYGQKEAIAVTWADNNYSAENVEKPVSFGDTVTVPYTYTVADVRLIPIEVSTHAGATLYGNGQKIVLKKK